MSFEKIDGVVELSTHVTQLKNEIRSTFASHKKLLESRQQWLLDLADSLKQRISALIQQEISLAELNMQLEGIVERMQFSDIHKDAVGIEAMARLQEKVKDGVQPQGYQLPTIQFVHDQVVLQNMILTYGKLQSSGDDTESCSTDRSWDFADEKADVECNGKEFCSVDNGCCSKQIEIEDMDLSSFLNGGNSDYKPNEAMGLKNVCRANELCQNISECVCETPCSVGLFHNQTNVKEGGLDLPAPPRKIRDAKEEKTAVTESLDHVAFASHQSSSATGGTVRDPVWEVSNAVQSILTAPIEDGVKSAEARDGLDSIARINNIFKSLYPKLHEKFDSNLDFLKESMKSDELSLNLEHCDDLEGLHQKLQELLDSDPTFSEEPVKSDELSLIEKSGCADRVDHSSHPWVALEECFREDESCDDAVVGLKMRLAKIFQADNAAHYDVKGQEENSSSPDDPVVGLSNELRKILSC